MNVIAAPLGRPISNDNEKLEPSPSSELSLLKIWLSSCSPADKLLDISMLTEIERLSQTGLASVCGWCLCCSKIELWFLGAVTVSHQGW
jgi:hypothetical protein